jgi:hypothetical protein
VARGAPTVARAQTKWRAGLGWPRARGRLRRAGPTARTLSRSPTRTCAGGPGFPGARACSGTITRAHIHNGYVLYMHAGGGRGGEELCMQGRIGGGLGGRRRLGYQRVARAGALRNIFRLQRHPDPPVLLPIGSFVVRGGACANDLAEQALETAEEVGFIIDAEGRTPMHESFVRLE